MNTNPTTSKGHSAFAIVLAFALVCATGVTRNTWAADPAPSSSQASTQTTTEKSVKKNTAKPGVNREVEDIDVDVDVEIVPGQKGQPGKGNQERIVVKKLTPDQVKQLQAQFAGPKMATLKMRNVAYLGVATVPVSRELGVHLKLAEGFGLMVVHVEKDSPADQAGIAKDDVLHKLNDQLIINTEQLGTLVRSHKKDDKIKVTVFRQGESKTLEATLSEKKAMPINLNPKAIQLRLIENQPGGAGIQRVQPGANPARFQIAPMMHMKWHDGTHELSITQKDGKKHLIAKDKKGTVLFDGPIDSDEDRKAVPEEIKPKLEKLEKSTRLKVMPFKGGTPNAIPGLKQGNVDHRRIMQMIDQHLSELNRDGQAKQADKQANRSVADLRKRIHDDLEAQLEKLEMDFEQFKARMAAQPADGVPPGKRLFSASFATASFSDKEHSLILKANEDGKHLIAKDKEGTVLFEGPVNSEAERKAVPALILAKLKTLEESTKISIRINSRRVTP